MNHPTPVSSDALQSARDTIPEMNTTIMANGAAKSRAMPPRLQASNLSKRFGALQALSDVSLTLEPGTFRALLGENGAGKSTLVKCIMGTYRSDTGKVIVGDAKVEISNPRQAHALGLGMVYQHFTLVENMTVVENMVMAQGHVPAIINWKKETARLDEFMQQMPFRVKPGAVVRHLSAGEKQKAELLKQLYLQRKILILDEPTSVLTPAEADELLGMVRGMCTQGLLSVLIITHKFREVMAFCDAVTVLRHGKFMGEGLVKDLTPETMSQMMMGTATLPEQAARVDMNGHAHAEKPPLVIKELYADDETGIEALAGLSLKVHKHEIVGIAGISGNGQRELVQVIAGQRSARSGQVLVNDKPYLGSREEMLRHRFHVLPEMPLHNACVGNMTTGENLAFREFDRHPMTRIKWFSHFGSIRAHAEKLIQMFNVKPASPNAYISHLSGGNIQRAVLARELRDDSEVLIVSNPCFGLDFKAVAEIRSRIMQSRNRGAAVLLLSEDLDEILELADRILVISDGKIVHETTTKDADRQTIGSHMAGH